MPAQNYVLLERVTVGEAGASSITFNSIPQTGYTDLKIVGSTRSTTSDATLLYRFNGTTTGYTGRVLLGTGSVAQSGTMTTLTAGAGGTWGRASDTGVNPSSSTTSTFSNWEMYVPNYTSANNKSASLDAVYENNATTADQDLDALLWSNTAAITSVSFAVYNLGSFAQYSTFSLYGLAAVGTTPTKAPKATGGSIIQTDGTYWYHAFLASGTFTPAVGLSCDVLVVAGGGGGSAAGGGGGAGGYQTFTAQSVAASAQTITVGAGGAGGTAGTYIGAVGTNSSFAALTASVGGGYGSSVAVATAPGNGGSGGGSGKNGVSAGTGTSGQGFAGGTSNNASGSQGSGGGGGATAAGTSIVSTGPGGAGGAGSNSVSSWATATATGVSGYYAGGGAGGGGFTAAGGTGGSGGGGTGGTGGGTTGTAGTAATANTGSGGGGGGPGSVNDGVGGKGGSGIVIIRYAV